MNLLIFRVRHDFSCSFVVLIGTYRSQKNWHLLASCTEQQRRHFHGSTEKLQSNSVDVIQFMVETHSWSEESSGGADQD